MNTKIHEIIEKRKDEVEFRTDRTHLWVKMTIFWLLIQTSAQAPGGGERKVNPFCHHWTKER